MTNIEYAQEISSRIGTSPVPFESVYSLALSIYQELGGTEETFADIYSILLETLPLASGATTTYTAGQNIDISTGNTISALGYVYDATKNSFKTGTNTTASGNYSHAEGRETQALGHQSHAEGYLTKANASITHTEGYNTIANNITEHAQGGCNISHSATTAFDGNSGNTIHSIGIGLDESARTNAVEIMQNGDYYLKGVGNYDGKHIKGETGAPSGLKTLQEVISDKQDNLTGYNNIYIGSNNFITALGYTYDENNESIWHGNNCSTSAAFTHAEGNETMANNDYAHAEGIGTQALNVGEHAEGMYNISHDNGGSTLEGSTSFSIGIGEDDSNRYNGIEVMKNGDIYVYGVGYYDGTQTKEDNPDIMTLQDIIHAIADATGLDLGIL